MKNNRRAIRRHHKERIRNKWRQRQLRNYHGINYFRFKDKIVESNLISYSEFAQLWAVYYGESMPTCSRSCCGNPRKYYNELTLQEKKSNIYFRNWEKEE